MAKTENEIRSAAWDNALHCHGTYAIFSRRLRRLKWKTKARDFWAFAIPITIGAMASSNELAFPEHYQYWLKVFLAVAALVQVLIALWSIFSRWDESLAYSSRASRDAYEMKHAWQKIGANDVDDIQLEFKSRSSQQAIIDSHDIGQDISDKELNYGMRNGLIEYRRACVQCGEKPTSRKIPIWPKQPCPVCGGNRRKIL